MPLFVAAVDAVDDTYLKTAYTLGATSWQAVEQGAAGHRLARHLPGACAWASASAGATSSSRRWWTSGEGLGGIIITSQRRGPREHIYLVLLVIVAVAFLTDKLWVALGRRLFPYREATR